MTRKTRSLRRKVPLWFAIMAGASAVALVSAVLLLTARSVQADAGLSRSTLAAPASSLGASAAPATLARKESAVPQGSPNNAARRWKDRLHGIASWYGGVFNGRRTASGEVFDMYAMTACHPTLPFGSIVRVVNRSNHRSVVVRITDRGDLLDEGRVIDLSYGAAQKLGMTWGGLAHVDLQVLSVGKPHAAN
jgi:rare lipoprotein A